MTNKHPHNSVLFGVLAALIFGLGALPVLAGSRGLTEQVPASNQLPNPIINTNNPHRPAAFGGSSPLVIPAAAFTSDGYSPGSHLFSFGGGYLAGNSANYSCVIAPAYLPAGATVTDMFASVYDNDAGRDITVSLRRVDNFTGTEATLASASTSGAFAGIQVVSDATIDNPQVAHPDYAYYVTVCLGSSSLRLYSVRLYYGFADLAVTKLASDNPVNAGTTLTYTINITNTGAISATGVTLSDPLPLKLTYQNATASQGSCLESGGTVTCNLGDIPGSSTAEVTLVTTVNLFANGTITNTATASGLSIEENLDNNQGTVTVSIRPPNFLPIIIKSFP